LWAKRIPVTPRPGSDALRKTDKILAREIWNPLAAGIHDEPTRRPRRPRNRMSRAVLVIGVGLPKASRARIHCRRQDDGDNRFQSADWLSSI